MRLRISELEQTVKMVIIESAAEQLLNLPQNPTPQDVYSSVMDWMSMYQDPSIEPDAGLVDSVIANVMVKNQIRKDDEHIGSKLNMLRQILDPGKARRQSYRQDIESEMRELDPTGKKQKYGYQTPNSLRMEESKIRLTKRELRRIIRGAINESGYMSGHLQNAVRLDNLDGSSALPATSSRWYEFASLLELDTSDLDALAFELGLAGFEELETEYSGQIDDRLAQRIVDIGNDIFRSPEAAIWDALETVQ